MKCRFCQHELTHEFVNLGCSPPSNSFLDFNQLNEPEIYYPLKLFVCEKCFLAQIDEYKKSNEIFNQNYVYFSSFSKSWLSHARSYVDMIVERLKLNQNSHVIEIASNDGYLLQYFLEKQIQCMGIEPSANTAQVARKRGIETIEDFFGVKLATRLTQQRKEADLIIGNNVLAHVPDINDFVTGLKIVLSSNGVITMEFPHIMRLIEGKQFDTIYHEHYSYLSFHMVRRLFEKNKLSIFDVEELTTHGGSLRIYAKHEEDGSKPETPRVKAVLQKEMATGILKIDYYQNFMQKVNEIKYSLLSFLIEQKKEAKKVAAYGAAAKGNTLLNFCGIKKDLIEFVVDTSPYKRGKFLPGSHIPVVEEFVLKNRKPDYIIILPWNIREEIIAQLNYIKTWSGKFVVAIPKLQFI